MMITRLRPTARRLLQRFQRAISTGRVPLAISEALTGRSQVEWLSALLNDLDIALVAVDSAGHRVVVNHAAATILNIPAGRTTASEFGAVLKALAARALNQSEVSALMGAVETDPTAAFASTWVFADAPTYLGVASKPATYPGFEGRIWALYDNSDVAQAVEEDRQADALMRASSDAMLDPQVLLEAVWCDGRVVDMVHRDINEAGCAYFGISRRQFIGRSLLDPTQLDLYAKCAETGQPLILDAHPYRGDFHDELRYYDIRATRVRHGLISVTWRDVTERIESAERIAASEERFRLLTENIGDVVVRLTDDGHITWVSDSIEQVLGAPADHWMDRHVSDFVLPGRQAAVRKLWAEIAAAGSFIGRRRLRGADGERHWVHVRSEPFYDSDGIRDGIVASLRVIDQEVAVEHAAQEAIAHRDHRNRKLNEYLQAQTARLMSELNSAARYVESILPDGLDGPVAITARYMPAEELGGDSYDFRWIDEDHLVVYLADVSGHGVAPALLSVSVHNLVRSGSLDTNTLLQPVEVLTELNRLFQMDRHHGHYFTIWYGVYQASSRTLRFASAGHPPALVITADSAPEQLSTHSVPVGLLESTEFAMGTYDVPPGAQILLFSDGALEMGMPDGKQRTIEQLAAAYTTAAGQAEGALNTLVAKLQERSAPAAHTDDSAFVLLSFP